MSDDNDLPPDLQEIADLLWEHAHGAPPLEEDRVWQKFFAGVPSTKSARHSGKAVPGLSTLKEST